MFLRRAPTLRVLENGALKTGMPSRIAAFRSTWLVPMQKQPIAASAAQYLATNEEVGYVVIDVDPAGGRMALADLCAVPATIRCRILY